MEKATRMVIDHFENINRIPRCSKQEQQISRWLLQWAAEKGLSSQSDAAGNLVVRVPASTGFEQAPVVILQGHMDMVCEKRAGSGHDFSKDPIQMVEDGEWLRARETTLGADNGIALAMIMGLVEDPEVSHPPLELYFTVDEETGLTGVLKMDPSLLTGRILINLDSEDEGVFIVGCAGGRATTMDRPVDWQPMDGEYEDMRISIEGLRGGHSGVDIAKHRANANTIMARLLGAGVSAGALRLIELRGGTGRNVIPRRCDARIACRREQADTVKKAVAHLAETVENEYRRLEPDLSVRIEETEPAEANGQGIGEADTAAAIDLLTALPCGPIETDPDDPLLVQTSVNLAMVTLEGNLLKVVSSQRSSVASRLDAISLKVEAAGRLAGAKVHTDTGYPSWPVDRNSSLLKRCTALYRELFAAEPAVRSMHAGLECGVIGDRCPGMDMISLGPTMENPHSPSERLYLPSVEKVWRFLTALLASFGA